MNSLLALACLAILAALAFANESVDYCKLHCDNTLHGKNIGCNKTNALGKRCSKDAKAYTFSAMDNLRENICDMHNKLRNEIASGAHFTELPIAARMLTMQWDDELAKLAFYNVKECHEQYDFCHATVIYNNPGQNMATFKFEEGEIQPTETVLIAKAISQWLDGWEFLEDDIEDTIHPSTRFATMILDHNVAVGCSAASYKRGSFIYTIVCNYAYGIKNGDNIYLPSDVPASGCTDKNPQYNNLCDVADTDREIELLQNRK